MGIAQRPAGDAADMLLELAGLAGLRRPVAGIVHARRKLVGKQGAVRQHEEFQRQHADMVQRFCQRHRFGPGLVLNRFRQAGRDGRD